MASANDTRITPAPSFTDGLGVVWTISYQFAQRNGYNTTAHASEGLWHDNNVYMLGRNLHWWKLVTPNGNVWVDVGPDDPAALPSPIPPTLPTIANMTATPSSLPVGGGQVVVNADVTGADTVTLSVDGAAPVAVTLPATVMLT